MKQKAKKTSLRFIILSSLLAIEVLAALGIFIYLLFLNRIYPGIYAGDLNLFFLTPLEAKTKIINLALGRTSQALNFKYQDQQFQIDLSPLKESFDADSLINQSLEYGHNKFYFQRETLSLFKSLTAIQTQLSSISSQINQNALDSQLVVNGEEITTTPSKPGKDLDEEKLREEILSYLNTGVKPEEDLPVKEVSPKLTQSQAQELKKELDQIKLSPINLKFKDSSYSLDLQTILNLLDLSSTRSTLASANLFGQTVNLESVDLNNQHYSDVKLSLNQDKLKTYLKTLAGEIDRPVIEPVFVLDQAGNNGKGKVTDFKPPQEGYSLNIDQAAVLINQRLASADFSEITLPVDIVPPKNQLTNELGIKELLGEGVSHFYHSIPNRVFNVELAASRISGTLIPPGGIFSYNGALGEVSAVTGFKQGYIIKSGKTVLDDGGGVCQDSTTIFRAALNAGLPVVARTAHAYRVGYYEQDSPPGLDATVFAPSVDFKFKNDTPGTILVWATVAQDSVLYIDLYGTSDGRNSRVTTPIITSTTPPLPDVHQDDPTLPKGTVKQVDFSAPGASVVFSRNVTRDNQTLIQETYHSSYQPWANVFLVGTK